MKQVFFRNIKSTDVFLRLIEYLKHYKIEILVVIISLFAVTSSLLGLGYFVRKLVDSGLVQGHYNIINHLIVVLIGLICVFCTGSFFRSYFINLVSENVVNRIREDAYNNLVMLELESFESLKTGDIISRFTVDIEFISKIIINFLSFFIRNFIMFLGALPLMFFQSVKLSLISLLIIPLISTFFLKFSKHLKFLSKKSLEMQGSIVSDIEETISNIFVIKAFNRQWHCIQKFCSYNSEYILFATNRFKVRAFFFAFAIASVLLSITLIIWIGSRDILYGNLTSGQMLSFIYYALVASLSASSLFELLSEAHISFAAAERVFFVVDLSSKSFLYDKNFHNFDLKKLQFDCISHKRKIIEFENVSFSYPSRSKIKIFKDLSFSIQDNQFVGIVGKSGVGKSTIFQLLLKFYLPHSGFVKIIGLDIKDLDSQALRRRIGYVPQDNSIFAGSIKSNIAFSRPEASTKEIKIVAEITGVTEFVDGFPMGLDTEIGSKGIRLSGGQKQRIAISRALLYNPDILLLDEAMSAFDYENEQKVLKRIREFLNKTTIISISHRISALHDADNILVLDNKKIIAEGRHESLIKECYLYNLLQQEQNFK